MGYEKFLGIAVNIFPGFSCERFLRISTDSQERFLGISTDFLQNCYLERSMCPALSCLNPGSIADPWLQVEPPKTLLNPTDSLKNKLYIGFQNVFHGVKFPRNSQEFLKTNSLNKFPLKSVYMVTKS